MGVIDQEIRKRNDEIYSRVKRGENIDKLAMLYELPRRKILQLVSYREAKYGKVDKEKKRKDYIKEKIKVLEELGIKLTPEQDRYIWNLRDEVSIDRYARDLFMRG